MSFQDKPTYPYYTYTLKNGIRLVYRYTPSQVAHCGVTIDVGSRDEKVQENGMAHFIEHCIFKGTKKRHSYQILSRIDGVGGELNAYTTKEETCLYATFLNNYYERVIELFYDILFNSIFPAKELEKEKSVIIDEINSYEDSPADLIFDAFERLVFGNTGLGRMILGTPKKVQGFTSEQVKDFIDKNYCTNLIVISTVGNIDFNKWVRICEKYFSLVPEHLANRKRHTKYNYKPQHIEEKRDTYQAHLMVGNIAYSYKNKNKVAFSLLNNILGSNAMNSALNMHIRERYGFTYALESSYTAYCDSGIFQVYAGTDEKYIDKTLQLIIKEMESFANKRLTQSSLARAKEQLKGQIAIQYDSNQNEMLSIGKALLNYDRIDDIKETYREIDQVTAVDVLKVANEIFVKDNLSTIKYI
ncbi:MAG: insulinase family protein [Bacteroidales bacterium]|jgi:predicted Zn-dependent peptidase|nr:insulinase family protein [Bacteroidales bacterium]